MVEVPLVLTSILCGCVTIDRMLENFSSETFCCAGLSNLRYGHQRASPLVSVIDQELRKILMLSFMFPVVGRWYVKRTQFQFRHGAIKT